MGSAPDENRFAIERKGEMGVSSHGVFEGKTEALVNLWHRGGIGRFRPHLPQQIHSRASCAANFSFHFKGL